MPLSLSITPRSKRAEPFSITKTTFYHDILHSLLQIIEARVLEIPNNSPYQLLYLRPPPPMDKTGCWCKRPSVPYRHTWKSCPNKVPRAIIAETSILKPCSHKSTEEIGHLFCFQPFQAAGDYFAWFLQIPGPPTSPLSVQDTERLKTWLGDYYFNDRTSPVPEDALSTKHLDLLSRCFVELRQPPPRSDRCGGWYDAERAHMMLDWEHKPVSQCMDILLPLMEYAARERSRRFQVC